MCQFWKKSGESKIAPGGSDLCNKSDAKMSYFFLRAGDFFAAFLAAFFATFFFAGALFAAFLATFFTVFFTAFLATFFVAFFAAFFFVAMIVYDGS